MHDHSFLMKKEANQCLTLHRQPCRACPISPTFTPHLEIICRDTQDLYLVVNGTPPVTTPELALDNHLSGPSLPGPLTNKFDLPDPATFPRPLCGTPLPDVTDDFVLSRLPSTPMAVGSTPTKHPQQTPEPRTLRRSTRLRK